MNREGKMMNQEYPFSNLTEKIIGAAFKVHNRIGAGFQEKIYENALAQELTSIGLKVEQQKSLNVIYGGKPVGDFVADMLVDQCVLLELKASRALEKAHEDQLINYLKTSGIEIGLLINFGPSVQIRRKIFSPAKPSAQSAISDKSAPSA
jgi:GxxExxY protein